MSLGAYDYNVRRLSVQRNTVAQHGLIYAVKLK